MVYLAKGYGRLWTFRRWSIAHRRYTAGRFGNLLESGRDRRNQFMRTLRRVSEAFRRELRPRAMRETLGNIGRLLLGFAAFVVVLTAVSYLAGILPGQGPRRSWQPWESEFMSGCMDARLVSAPPHDGIRSYFSRRDACYQDLRRFAGMPPDGDWQEWVF